MVCWWLTRCDRPRAAANCFAVQLRLTAVGYRSVIGAVLYCRFDSRSVVCADHYWLLTQTPHHTTDMQSLMCKAQRRALEQCRRRFRFVCELRWHLPSANSFIFCVIESLLSFAAVDGAFTSAVNRNRTDHTTCISSRHRTALAQSSPATYVVWCPEHSFGHSETHSQRSGSVKQRLNSNKRKPHRIG